MTDSIVAWLRSRPTLLIIDNCEHVLDHAATLVAAVEAGAPEATVLATSREPLGLPGEVVRRVPSLDPATDAVYLFAERASTASDAFVLNDTNRPVIASICARLDGIPLAIELAAARVRALTPAEILARLDDRFRLLRSSGRGGHERHQTLLATVTWSVELLSPEDRCLFERLSVFAGSFSLGDAEAVCGLDPLDPVEVVDLLSALVDRSMVVAEAGRDAVTRYRLLETLRQYGEQALVADSSTATMRARHLAHFLGRAEHWYAQQQTADEPEANRAFAINWDNLRAAFDWALATGRGRDRADLLGATYWFAVHTGRWEHRDWAIAARATGADTGQIASSAVVLWAALAGEPDTETFATLDPAAPDLAARDVEALWDARALTAMMTNDVHESERVAAWLHEREPRCTNPIAEAWILSVIITSTLSAPDPAVAARVLRLGQASPSPSVQAIAGLSVHGNRCLNPVVGDGLDLGDVVEAVQEAIACSRLAGNLFVEATLMTFAVFPLTDGDDRGGTAVLRATLGRIHEIRYGLALTFLAARLGVWLVRIGRPVSASVVEGWLGTHLPTPYPLIQSTVDELHQLLNANGVPDARSGGTAMTPTDLTEYLDDELAKIIDENAANLS